MPERLRVIVVEDDVMLAEDLRLTCEDLGIDVLDMIHSAEGAAERILERRPDYVLMDVRLGGRRDGVDIAEEVYRSAPEIRLVFVTGSNEPPTIRRINEDHPFRILIKPTSPQELRDAFGL